jgi:hypothetical protein
VIEVSLSSWQTLSISVFRVLNEVNCGPIPTKPPTIFQNIKRKIKIITKEIIIFTALEAFLDFI